MASSTSSTNGNLTTKTTPSPKPSTTLSTTENVTGHPSVIWYKNPGAFLTDANITHFIPTKDDPLPEQLNAVMRFAIYFTIVVMILRRDINLLFVVFVVGAATYVINESNVHDESKKKSTMEHLDVTQEKNGEVCMKPTPDNPFMNVTPNQYRDFPNRPPACKMTNEQVRRKAEEYHNHNLYMDVGDVYGRVNASRQFYTMPSTTIPNDQTAFAEWLYKTGPTCKEGNGFQCLRQVEPRYQ